MSIGLVMLFARRTAEDRDEQGMTLLHHAVEVEGRGLRAAAAAHRLGNRLMEAPYGVTVNAPTA